MLVYGALPGLAPNGTARSRKHPWRSPKPKLSVLHLPRRIGLPPGVAYLCQPHPETPRSWRVLSLRGMALPVWVRQSSCKRPSSSEVEYPLHVSPTAFHEAGDGARQKWQPHFDKPRCTRGT